MCSLFQHMSNILSFDITDLKRLTVGNIKQASAMDHVVPQIERELRAKYSHLMVRWYEAVDWTEPLIVGLIVFQAALLLTVVTTRKRLGLQAVIFVLIVSLLAFAERLNSWAHNNWRLFASQQYFDQRGVFVGIFLAGPLLFTGFVQLVSRGRSVVTITI